LLDVPPAGSGQSSRGLPITWEDLNWTSQFVTSFAVTDSHGSNHDLSLCFFHLGTDIWLARLYGRGEDFGSSSGDFPRQILTKAGAPAAATFYLFFSSGNGKLVTGMS